MGPVHPNHLLTLRMIRTKGEAGTGDVVEAVKHQRTVMADIRKAAAMSDDELYAFAKELSAPYHLLKETARLKRLPVVSCVEHCAMCQETNGF